MQPQPNPNGQHRPRSTRAEKEAASRADAWHRQEAAAQAQADELAKLAQRTQDLGSTCQSLADALNNLGITVTIQPEAELAVALGAAFGDPVLPMRIQVALMEYQALQFRTALERAHEIREAEEARRARAALLEGVPTTQTPSGLVVPGA